MLPSPCLPGSIQTRSVFSLVDSDSTCCSIWVLHAQIDLLLHFSSKMERQPFDTTSFVSASFLEQPCLPSLACLPAFLPQLVPWWHIKIYAECSLSLEKSKSRTPTGHWTQEDENFCFKIEAKPIVCKMMIKQKLLKIINHHFLKCINVFSYPYMLISKAKRSVLVLSYLQQFYGCQFCK